MAGQSRSDMKKIFDLLLEIRLGEFLDWSNIIIKELAYNMQKITPVIKSARPKLKIHIKKIHQQRVLIPYYTLHLLLV